MLRVAFIFFRHFFPGIFGSLSVERAFTETAITFRPRFEQEKKEATGSRFVLLRGRSKQFFRSKIAKLSWENVGKYCLVITAGPARGRTKIVTRE